jgi:hypothetical protein
MVRLLMVCVVAGVVCTPAAYAKQPTPPPGCTIDKKVTTCVTVFPQTIVWDTHVRAVGDPDPGSEADPDAASCPYIYASEDGYVREAQWYTEVQYATYDIIRTVVTDKKGVVISGEFTQSEATPEPGWYFAYCGEPIPA